MIFKCFLFFICALVPISCYFAGDRCSIGGQLGTCKLLSKCLSLVDEIRQAGAPMPGHMRRKLQRLGCGFDNDLPLVCCDDFSNTDYDTARSTTQRNTWSTSTPYSPGSNENHDQNPYSHFGDHNKNGDLASNSIEQLPNIQDHPNLRLLPSSCGAVEGERIFGGNRTRLFEMPWMVLLAYDSARGSKLSCGGTLITERYVLTAAHCVSFLGNRLSLRDIRLGEYDVRTDPDCERVEGDLYCATKVRNVSIDKLIAHPGYSPQTLTDDIALIRLSEPADFNLDSMKPICLPTTPQLQSEKLEGLQGVVAGWGATEDGLQSPVLLSVDLPVISNRECQAIYTDSPRIYDKQVCAGGVPDKDSCGGDSGGPLMYPGRTSQGVRYVQHGIVSYGSKRCGLGGFPGVYTRTAYYMDWILDNICD